MAFLLNMVQKLYVAVFKFFCVCRQVIIFHALWILSLYDVYEFLVRPYVLRTHFCVYWNIVFMGCQMVCLISHSERGLFLFILSFYMSHK